MHYEDLSFPSDNQQPAPNKRTSNRPTQGQGGQIAQLEQTILKMADPVQKKTRGVRTVDPADEANPMAPEPKKKKPSRAKKSKPTANSPALPPTSNEGSIARPIPRPRQIPKPSSMSIEQVAQRDGLNQDYSFSNPDSLRPSFTQANECCLPETDQYAQANERRLPEIDQYAQANEHHLPETDHYRSPSHSGFFNSSYSGTGYQGSGNFSGPTQQGNAFYSGDYANSGSNFPSAGPEDFNSLDKQNKNFYGGFIDSSVNQGASVGRGNLGPSHDVQSSPWPNQNEPTSFNVLKQHHERNRFPVPPNPSYLKTFTSSTGNQDDQEEIDDDPDADADADDDDEADEDLNDSTATWSSNHQPASSEVRERYSGTLPQARQSSQNQGLARPPSRTPSRGGFSGVSHGNARSFSGASSGQASHAPSTVASGQASQVSSRPLSRASNTAGGKRKSAGGSKAPKNKPEVTDATLLGYYPSNIRDLILVAQSHLQLHMALYNPFLDLYTDAEVFYDCLQKAINEGAAREESVEAGYLEEHRTNIKRYLYKSQKSFRSSLKTEVLSQVKTAYELPLSTSRDPSTIGHNAQQYENLVKVYNQDLLRNGSFLLNGFDDEGHTNNFDHPCLQSIIRDFFYIGSTSLARKYKKEFKDKVPYGVLALVATTMDHCISLYQNGASPMKKDFDATNGHASYTAFTAGLVRLKKDTYHGIKLENNVAAWARDGLEAAGINETGSLPLPIILD